MICIWAPAWCQAARVGTRVVGKNQASAAAAASVSRTKRRGVRVLPPAHPANQADGVPAAGAHGRRRIADADRIVGGRVRAAARGGGSGTRTGAGVRTGGGSLIGSTNGAAAPPCTAARSALANSSTFG